MGSDSFSPILIADVKVGQLGYSYTYFLLDYAYANEFFSIECAIHSTSSLQMIATKLDLRGYGIFIVTIGRPVWRIPVYFQLLEFAFSDLIASTDPLGTIYVADFSDFIWLHPPKMHFCQIL